MANEKNLIPLNKRAKSLQREIQSKGGKAKAKKDKEKRTIQEIVNTILSKNIDTCPMIAEVAEKMGIEDCKSIKELMSFVAVINTLNIAKIDDLEKLSRLLGEDKQNENADVLAKLDEVIGEVDKLAE